MPRQLSSHPTRNYITYWIIHVAGMIKVSLDRKPIKADARQMEYRYSGPKAEGLGERHGYESEWDFDVADIQ